MSEKFTFFWGECPFSQWCQTPFEIDGIHYCTAEQWMMAEKAKLFDDYETRQAILNTSSPKEQKRLGRQVKGFDEIKWKEKRFDIVYRGNYAKFIQSHDNTKALLDTKGTTLVEASPYDKIWGIGMAAGEEGIEDPKNWKGLNLLGEVLTKVRETFLEIGEEKILEITRNAERVNKLCKELE